MKCLLADKAHSLTTLDFTHTRTHPLLLTSILSSLTCGRMATQGHLMQQWLAMSLTQITLLMAHAHTHTHTHTNTHTHTHTHTQDGRMSPHYPKDPPCQSSLVGLGVAGVVAETAGRAAASGPSRSKFISIKGWQ